MERRSLGEIFLTLNNADVRYLVAGGLAVLAHGYVRVTQDIDLVLDLETENLLKAMTALEELGFQPSIPVRMVDFADPENRNRWVEEKGAMVFQVFSDTHPTARIDLFIEAPFDFGKAFGKAKKEEIAPGIRARFVGIEDLISMKRKAARPKDLEDVAQLEILRDEGRD